MPADSSLSALSATGIAAFIEKEGLRMASDAALYSSLMATAVRARENAYCPYSHFAVGAALLASDGQIFRGCNIENAAYSPAICAERCALAAAVGEGERVFLAIAIVGGPENQAPNAECAPCGVCRQTLAEFAGSDFMVLLGAGPDSFRAVPFAQLFPFAFGPQDLA